MKPSRKPTARVLTLVATYVASVSVFAADRGRTRDTPDIEEVIVTAQKRSERLQEVPISITVMSGDEIDRSSLIGTLEALNRIPGVFAGVGFGGATQVRIRGVGASGPSFDGSSPIGYYLDSVPLARIRSSVVPDSNAYDLERIEVLRGPQGTLYGVNAENGLVRVLTRDADLDDFELKARTTFSSTDGGGENYRGDMAVNVPVVAGKLAVRAVAGYQSLSGWVDRSDKDDINEGVVRNYRLKVSAQPTESLSLGISAWHSQDEYEAPSWSDDNGRNANAQLDEPIANDFEAYTFKLGYSVANVSISSTTSYVDYTLESVTDLNPAGLGTTYIYNAWSKTLSQEIIVNSNQQGPWRWTAGVFYRDADDRYVEEIPEDTDPSFPVAFLADVPDTAESYAVFGEVSRRFLDNKLEWTLGLRYFHDKVSSGQGEDIPLLPGFTERYSVEDSSRSTTPRAVLTWYPSDDMTIYTSYSQGFRSSVPQSYPTALQSPTLPDVRPDQLRNYEIGVKGNAWDRRLSFDSSVYYMDWRDVQQTFCIPDGGGVGLCYVALANGTSASGPGIDLGLTLRPTDGLDLGVSASWNDLVFDGSDFTPSGALMFRKGDRLGLSSEWTLGASADYRFPLGAGGLNGLFSASANYTSKQIDRNFTPSGAVIVSGDSLLTARTSVSIEGADDRWSAMLFADNVTNEDGIAGVENGGPRGFWSPRLRPRTVGVQLEYRW